MAPPDPDIALGLAAFGDRPLDEAIEAGQRAGYRRFDLQLDSILRISQDDRLHSGPGRAALRSRLDQEGLSLLCVSNVRDCQLLLGPHGEHTAPINPGDASTRRRHALDAASRTIETAHDLGAELTRFFFGCPDFGRWFHWPRTALSWDDNLKALADELPPILELAAGAGVRVTLETHPKQVVHDLRSANRLLEILGAEGALGICADPANLAAVGHDPEVFLRGLDRAPLAVHMKDVEVGQSGACEARHGWATFGPGPPARFRALGWGGLNWRGCISALVERGFTGPYVVEHEDVLMPRESGVAASLRVATELTQLEPAADRWW